VTQKHYLLKVLGLSGIPKLITFGLTLVSFPMLVRALGAAEYGVVLFIGAAFGIVEVLLDFGVSSAAGKAMASVRGDHPNAIRTEFFAWARLQIVIAIVGFFPMMLAAYLLMKGKGNFQFAPSLMYVMGAAAGTSVALNFIRPNLLSLLAFKSLAVLDTFESVVRSMGLVVVATVFPTAMGLAVAGLITSAVASTLAAILIWRRLSDIDTGHAPTNQGSYASVPHMAFKWRLRESANFVWLRLSTRLLQEGPLLIVGRVLGPEVVGVIGAIRKVNEIISTPYLVIGNAFMVRVNEISRNGINALLGLWDAAFRITSTSVVFTAILYIGSDLLAQMLLPESHQAKKLFPIMILIIVPYTVACLIPAMSDYIGGLFRRTILVTIFAVVQLPVLWFMSSYGPALTLASLVIIYTLMVVGYTMITSNLLFGSCIPRIRSEVIAFIGMVLLTGVVVAQLNRFSSALSREYFSDHGNTFIYAQIVIFCVVAGVGILLYRETRAFYFNRKFFEFESELSKGAM
jgi:O-antigen/teichoic acid export membrane protein